MRSSRNLSRVFSCHFPSVVIGTLALLLGACILLSLAVFHSNDEDTREYRRLMTESNPTISDMTLRTPYTATQDRTGVQKDVLVMQGNDRLRMRLISDAAHLVLDYHPEGTELIENMQDVKCYMQEELFYLLPDGREAHWHTSGKLLVKDADPSLDNSWVSLNTKGVKPMQVVRYLEADTAAYYYKTDMFKADNVNVSRYIVPGHDFVESAQGMRLMMAGKAKSVEFSLAGKDVNFNAYQMKAKLYTAGRPL